MSKQVSLTKNTIILYVRIIVVTIVTLFSSRTILQALGDIDYGIYNVIFGIVGAFQIINGALVVTGNRFLISDMVENPQDLENTFSLLCYIHLFLAAIVSLVVEVIGLYLIANELVIPSVRLNTAYLIFHISVIVFFLSVIKIPYNSIVISNERFNIQAYADMVYAIGVLVISLIIRYIDGDQLLLFVLGILIVNIIVFLIYFIYSKQTYSYCRIRGRCNFSRIGKLFSFASWNFLGSTALAIKMQGTNILLNMFFGPIVNTSRGIAFQVNSALNSLSSVMVTAIGPRIIKYYDKKDYDKVNTLVNRGAKYSFIVYFIFCLPLYLSIDYVLTLWLGQVPQYADDFTRLILVYGLYYTFSSTLTNLVVASKAVKSYHVTVSIIEMCSFGITYLLLIQFNNPNTVFLMYIAVAILLIFVKALLLRNTSNLHIRKYFMEAFLPCVVVALLSYYTCNYVFSNNVNSFAGLVLVTLTSLFIIICLSWVLALTNNERNEIKKFVKKKYTDERA
jgi:O-antigen/teichoic acid export membrane protein